VQYSQNHLGPGAISRTHIERGPQKAAAAVLRWRRAYTPTHFIFVEILTIIFVFQSLLSHLPPFGIKPWTENGSNRFCPKKFLSFL
jgi:hypothetical protein